MLKMPFLASSLPPDANAAEANVGTPTAQAVDGRRLRTEEFERVMIPLLDKAYNLARSLAGNREDAEDVVQDAYLRAFRYFEVGRIHKPRSWIMSIVRNTFYNGLAKTRGSLKGLLVKTPPTGDLKLELELWHLAEETPEAVMIRRTETETIRSLVEALPPKYRETLMLREIEELSYREISEIIGVPVGTVMSRLARARGLLAAAWRRSPCSKPARRRAAGIVRQP
jgi:RNA polymerase sigma-70 factor (ECF subfamily)